MNDAFTIYNERCYFSRVDRGEFDVLLQVQQNVVITDDEESNENPEIDNTVPRDKKQHHCH